MFADDKNLFYSHHNIKTLLSTVNEELEKLGGWFTANRVSLNVKKPKYTFFHKNSVKDNIPVKLPDLDISYKSTERKSSIKFLGVLLDEHIAWNDHIHAIERRLAKNIDLLYRARQFLDNESFKTVYFSYIHSYLSYANIAWTKYIFYEIKNNPLSAKTCARIIFDEDILTHSRPLLRSLNALNIYQINLHQQANFMYKFQKYWAPKIFNMASEKPTYKYPTQFSETKFKYKKYSLTSTKHSISVRGPKTWNEFLTKEEKEIQSHYTFLRKIKTKLLESDNERKYL